MLRLGAVTGVTNAIEVRPLATVPDIAERIRKAFHRNAELDAGDVRVVVSGGTVTLGGHARDLTERSAAERAVWSAADVTEVINRLSVY